MTVKHDGLPGACVRPRRLLDLLALARRGRLPEKFQRDRTEVLDYTSGSGYSHLTQLADCTVVIADCTSDSYDTINAGGPQPILKAYRVREEDLA